MPSLVLPECEGKFFRRFNTYVLAAAPIAAIYTMLIAPAIDRYGSYFGMYHDDGLYVVIAKALSDGQGFRIISLPGSPLEEIVK